MTQPSGWYDDPKDPSQLRYWDGVVWSDHVTPKVSPTVEQSNIGMPYGVTPAAARREGSGSPQQDQGQAQEGGQWPAYGRGPGQLAPQQAAWQSHPAATTPDGVALSGWWKRVLAWIIDSIIVFVVALPLTFVPLGRTFSIARDHVQKVMDAVEAGSSTMPAQPTSELAAAVLPVSLILLAFSLVYQIAFLTTTGATIGKRIVGISVRLRDKPGPPPLAAVLKRTAVKEGAYFIGLVPPFWPIDVLWPLWDDKKQAIHDKAGATNVVVGRQPRRDA